MGIFEVQAKRWGNSIGIVIPKQITEEEGIEVDETVRVMLLPKEPLGKRIWGKIPLDKPTQELLDEVDKDFEPELFR